eukprot:TRINITY_DN1032_c0_g1_i1.p1 TRINITY_DN1032_c0_g1~~TRINITY_DN1032_c0_g1_i1.p1  ORF type:complete len:148 (+),score=37.20 TRINITY_DN1032_c0_g1_i1:64-507(+)
MCIRDRYQRRVHGFFQRLKTALPIYCHDAIAQGQNSENKKKAISELESQYRNFSELSNRASANARLYSAGKIKWQALSSQIQELDYTFQRTFYRLADVLILSFENSQSENCKNLANSLKTTIAEEMVNNIEKTIKVSNEVIRACVKV